MDGSELAIGWMSEGGELACLLTYACLSFPASELDPAGANDLFESESTVREPWLRWSCNVGS